MSGAWLAVGSGSSTSLGGGGDRESCRFDWIIDIRPGGRRGVFGMRRVRVSSCFIYIPSLGLLVQAHKVVFTHSVMFDVSHVLCVLLCFASPVLRLADLAKKSNEV